jgi:hypothetical protein
MIAAGMQQMFLHLPHPVFMLNLQPYIVLLLLRQVQGYILDVPFTLQLNYTGLV